ncbi:S24 family peptidase [Rhizobium sp. RU36D]|uniref:LexA family transcriptional regulator n=1 Tax=Rhizobium sp. RU36D TaxID=1907415 RepID=UPI000A056CCB|nr:S24 family peptidase [Rhizobium sp. RU36D]
METTLYTRIKERLDALGMTESAAAAKATLGIDAIRNLRRRHDAGELSASMSTKSLEKLAPVLQVSVEWLLHGDKSSGFESSSTIGRIPSANASFPPRYQSFDRTSSVPLLGQAATGPNGMFVLNGAEVGRLFTPPMLEGVAGAYGVRVFGTSMVPRYVAGETVWINPHEPVRQGDDVVVQILTDVENERQSYIKQFVSQSSKVTRLLQHNPEEGEEKELIFPTDRVFSVHKIVFHATI